MGLLYVGLIPVHGLTVRDERSQGHFKACKVTLLLPWRHTYSRSSQIQYRRFFLSKKGITSMSLQAVR